MTTRVALVDDQALIRTGLKMIIDATADLAVVGEAADGASAVDLIVQTKPDVVLMDVRMPGAAASTRPGASARLPARRKSLS